LLLLKSLEKILPLPPEYKIPIIQAVYSLRGGTLRLLAVNVCKETNVSVSLQNWTEHGNQERSEQTVVKLLFLADRWQSGFCLYICGLPNDAFRSSDYVAINGTMISELLRTEAAVGLI
jgi:hypothetical protein